MEFLAKILAAQARTVAARQAVTPLAELQSQFERLPPPPSFIEALRAKAPRAFIAELKKASPSAGLLCADYEPVNIAKSYETNGASCLSILTNEFFQGTDEHFRAVSQACKLPLLRKDFIISEYQVYETRALGAAAMLLLVAALEPQQLLEFALLGRQLGLSILLEIHGQAEANLALDILKQLEKQLTELPDGILLGVNNRDLHSFKVDVAAGARVLHYLQEQTSCLLVAESGIKTPKDLALLRQAGAAAFLIGESFMSAPEPGLALRNLL